MMRKSQPEGRYEPMLPEMDVLNHTAVIRLTPSVMTGKYKIGQNMDSKSRTALAAKILERATPTAEQTLGIMGFKVARNKLEMIDEPIW